jgi:LuxR family transcriptional regulator, maltose regulon positive regulatory protein
VALLRSIDAANLFTVALDDDRTSYRYHHLVQRGLRAELQASDSARELTLQLRAGEWFESAGDTQRATSHFLAAQEVDRALALLHDRVMTDFLHEPALPTALDLRRMDPVLLTRAPERLLALAADGRSRVTPVHLVVRYPTASASTPRSSATEARRGLT